MKFVSLHSHSTFSYMDGFALPATHVERVRELGMTSLALTEHGNVSSHVQLEKAALKAGIKPIFGVEAYTAASDMRETKNRAKWHLTVLARDARGYRNLNRIVAQSYAKDMYQYPTVLGGNLADHSEGLTVLSGCADSLLACTLLGGKGKPDISDAPDYSAARKVVRGFQKLFGDNYYLEVQRFPGLDRTRQLNSIYVELGRELGVPLVATADVHYPFPDDNEMQKILHAAGRGIGSIAVAEQGWEYDILLTYPQSDKEIQSDLMFTGLSAKGAEEAIANSARIAEECDVTLPKGERMRYPVPAGQTEDSLIWAWLRDGWKYRARVNNGLRKRRTEYMKRVKYEMNLISTKGYSSYFLMLSDAVRFAKDAGIAVGPARGSAAASLVAYLLRITEVDPMQFPTMMFERFIDADREDLPDIDLDFASDRRDEVRQYLAKRYGADRVGNIGTFTRYRGKNAVIDVCRVYGIPKHEEEAVKALIIERSGGDSRFDASLADTRDTFPVAAAVFKRNPDLENAIRLEGNMRGFGVHAAGIVVGNTPINDICATYTREIGDHTLEALAYDKKDAEYLGLLKVDALGLGTMEMISLALGHIGMTLEELYAVPLDDKPTIAAFHRGDVIGIFQFEGRATRLVNNDVRPDNFMELADINALSRPGPLFSGATAQYVDVKHGRVKPDRLHPIVDKYTSTSQYQIIYQEQVLSIIRELGGFPVTKIADIRKIISQKLGEASFNTMREEFIAGAGRIHGVSSSLADRIFKLMVTSATYSFNVAHCVSYSMLAYWCQYLKQHWLPEFYAAALAKSSDKNFMALLKDADQHSIRILPPHPAKSTSTWAPVPLGVQAGWQQIPGVGEKMAKLIADEPEIKSWDDLIRVRGIGEKKLDKMKDFVESDDPFGMKRVGRALAAVEPMLGARAGFGLPYPTHRAGEISPDADNLDVTWFGFIKLRSYKDLIEDERARTGDPLDVIVARTRSPELLTSCVLHGYDDSDELIYLRFNRFSFPNFKDQLESISLDHDVIVARGLKRKGFGISIQVNELYVIDPDEEE